MNNELQKKIEKWENVLQRRPMRFLRTISILLSLMSLTIIILGFTILQRDTLSSQDQYLSSILANIGTGIISALLLFWILEVARNNVERRNKKEYEILQLLRITFTASADYQVKYKSYVRQRDKLKRLGIYVEENHKQGKPKDKNLIGLILSIIEYMLEELYVGLEKQQQFYESIQGLLSIINSDLRRYEYLKDEFIDYREQISEAISKTENRISDWQKLLEIMSISTNVRQGTP